MATDLGDTGEAAQGNVGKAVSIDNSSKKASSQSAMYYKECLVLHCTAAVIPEQVCLLVTCEAVSP
jgi:hypothetical protein